MKKEPIIKKMARLTWTDYRFVAEAAFWLLYTAVLIHFLPLRWWVGSIGRERHDENNPEDLSADEQKIIAGVRKNVFRANKVLFKPARCFGLALTIKRMLAGKGVQTSLHLGVQKDHAGNLRAHAWLMKGDAVLYGGKTAPGKFTQLVALS